MIRKAVGMALYFVTLWLWALACGTAVLLALPSAVLLFGAGFFVRNFTQEWPTFKEWWVWDFLRREWFDFTMEGDLDLVTKDMAAEGKSDDVPTLYAIYPHGHYALTTMFFWALNPKWKKARGAVHSVLFHFPIVNMLVGWCGMTSVTERDLVRAIVSDKRVYMCPGGIRDVANVGTDVTRRSGFLRVAREQKCRVIPVWCPDERDYYRQWLPLGRMLKRWFFFPIPIFVWGQWWCPFLPLGTKKSRIRFGKAIEWNDDNQEDAFWKELRSLQSKFS